MKIKDEIKNQRDRIRSIGRKIPFTFTDGLISIDAYPDWNVISHNVLMQVSSLDSNDITVLNVVFTEGGVIDEHFHDDRDKMIYIIDGTLYDRTNDVTFVAGQVYYVPKKTKHSFESDHCVLVITFKPPYPEL